MKKIYLLVVLLGITVLAMLPSEASAFYNPQTGRFLQRDPGPEPDSPSRVGTAGPAANGSFAQRDPVKQYSDGMNLYQYVRSNPLSYVDWIGAQATSSTSGSGTSSSTGADFVGPPEPPAGAGSTCGIKIYRSAICTLSPKKPSDFGHEWISNGATTWDFPKNYYSDPIQPCHAYDKNHPMWIWDAKVRFLGGKLPNGTPCSKATCGQIKKCLQEAEDEWAGTSYQFFGHNCIVISVV